MVVDVYAGGSDTRASLRGPMARFGSVILVQSHYVPLLSGWAAILVGVVVRQVCLDSTLGVILG